MKQFDIASTSSSISICLRKSYAFVSSIPTLSKKISSNKSISMKRFLYTLVTFLVFVSAAQAQNFRLRVFPKFPLTANVCTDMNDTITVRNIWTGTVAGITLTPTFPPGMTYVPSSITVLNGGAVTENNISNLGMPVFNLPTLVATGDSVRFIIKAKTDCGILSYLNLTGGTAAVTMRLDYTGGFDTYPQTGSPNQPINMQAPSVLIQSVTPGVISATNGTIAYRDIKFLNGGFGFTTGFRFTDLHTNAITIDSFNRGTVGINNVTFTELFIDTNVIKQFNGGIPRFRLNDTVVVRQYLKVNNCTSSGASTFNVMWGCTPGVYCDTTNQVANVNIGALTPNVIVQSIKNNVQSCNGPGAPSHKIMVLKNNGTSPATNLTQYLQMAYVNGAAYPRNNYWNSNSMDTASFRYRIGTNGTSMRLRPDSAWVNAFTINHFENNPTPPTFAYTNNIGSVHYNFGSLTLNPGDSLILEWDMYTECNANPR
jgi:hypothetical protein